MEVVSRFVEFDENNFEAYSIELAHLLFAAASEVDVVAKLVCAYLDPKAQAQNIRDYRSVLMAGIPTLPSSKVFVPRYGLTLEPWSNWAGSTNPDWWTSYNKVKHERSDHFNQATLKNALNSLAALLVITTHFYSMRSSSEGRAMVLPQTTLLRLEGDWFERHAAGYASQRLFKDFPN